MCELVRRRGLDPAVDRSAMRSLIDEVVTEYDARSLTSSLPQLTDSRKGGEGGLRLSAFTDVRT